MFSFLQKKNVDEKEIIEIKKKIAKIKKEIIKIIQKNNISYNNTILYSYWHDYKALALALLKKENKKNICIARAHRWDIYFYAHKFPYLPFKKFIIDNLSMTFSISIDGKKEFEKILSKNLDSKIIVSRLGKINNRTPLLKNNTKSITFCSCSSLISVKRVYLIIDILNKLPFKNINWIHFGNGYLLNELKQCAKDKISNINFQFKGIVPNLEILDFYRDNYVDLFINVSESEGIPVSIMEALSAGIPVISTNVGGTNEIVNNDVGFLIKKDFEITEVARIIENYLNSPIENHKIYRENAYNFWKENYTAEKNYTDFVNQILLL